MKNTFRKIAGSLLALVTLFSPLQSLAAGSYTLYNLPTMYLSIGISNTQVNGITIAPPYLNGTPIAIPAMSGAIFHVTQNGNEENMYAARVSVNSTTKVITLSGVIRDLCFNQSVTFTSCNGGRNFQKSANIILSDDARIFNLKANTDRPNTFTASGSIAFSGSGSFTPPSFATTAERDRQLGSNPSGPVRMACVVATGSCYLSTGGSWTVIAAGAGNANATETTSGIVQLGTIANHIAHTTTGTSGASTVVQTKNLTGSSVVHGINGTIAAGKVPILNASGALSATLGGLGRINATSGALLIARGSGAVVTLSPGLNGSFVKSNGTVWSTGSAPIYCQPVAFSGATSATFTNPTSATVYNAHTLTIPANDFVSGTWYEYEYVGSAAHGTSGKFDTGLKIGATFTSGVSFTATTGTNDFTIRGRIYGTAAASASSELRIITTGSEGSTSTVTDYDPRNFATNGSLVVAPYSLFETSNGGNNTTLFLSEYNKCSTTPF